MAFLSVTSLALLVGGAVAFFFSLRDPFKALLGILPFMIITQSFDLPVFGERIILFDLLFVIWLVAILARQLTGRRDLIIPRLFFWPVVLYYLALAGAVISLINGVSLSTGLQELLIYFYLGVIGFVIVGIVNTRQRLESISKVMILVLALAIALALWEVAAQTLSLPVLFEESTHRLAGTFRNTNQLAGFLRTLLPFAWAMLLVVTLPLWRKLGLLSLAVLAVLMLILTSSRVDTTAALIEIFALCIMAVLYAFRQRRFISTAGAILAVCFAFVAGIYVLPQIAGTFWQTIIWRLLPFFQGIVNATSLSQIVEGAVYNSAGRQFLLGNYSVSWQAFVDHPLIGTGIGNFGLAYDFVSGRNYEVHSAYMNLLAERGIFGAFWQLAFLGLGLYYAVSSLRKGNKIAWVAIALLASYIGSLASGVYVIFFRRREFWLTLALIISSWHIYSGLYETHRAKAKVRLRRAPLLGGESAKHEALGN